MQMKVRYFDYPAQFANCRQQYMAAIENTLRRGAFIMGKELEGFETRLARFCRTKYAVGVASCTDGLLLALWAAGIGPGDEVISVSHTFVATIEVIRLLGAKPVLIDIGDDHAMDVRLLERAITRRTRAIVPVHLNGRICSGMDDLLALSRRRGIAVIEDAAQAVGALYRGRQAGSFGLAGAFSFYPAKLLGAFGDAGAVITDNAAIAEKIRQLRDHGRGSDGLIHCWGFNCRLDNLQAAVLAVKLGKVKSWIARRRRIAAAYHRGLVDIPALRLPPAPLSGGERYDVFQNYEIEAQRRDALRSFLQSRGIGTLLPWGGRAVHQFPGLGLNGLKLPRTDRLFREVLMLPMYPELTDRQVELVISAVRQFYGRGVKRA